MARPASIAEPAAAGWTAAPAARDGASARAPRARPRKPRVTSKMTGTGWAIVAVSLAVAMAAANTGNNLLYLMLAVMIAAFPVSAAFVRFALRGVDAELLAPSEVRAGDAFEVAVPLTPRRSLGLDGVLLELRGLDGLRGGEAFEPASVAATRAGRGGAAVAGIPARVPRRGEVQLALVARSPFPFGMLDGRRMIATASLVVLPAPDPDWREGAAPASDQGSPRLEPGPGAEILDIRDHRAGDDARKMDWKATARLDRPMVRDFARDEERRALVVVDAVLLPAGIDRAAGAERAISRAAGAIEGLSRTGWRVALLLPGGRIEGEPATLLRALASVKVRQAGDDGWWLDRLDGRDSVLLFRSAVAR